MKQAVPETNFAWGDSKRKGKEKAMDSSLQATTSDTRWRDAMHGVAFCDGTCQPGPSCVLFPRRHDGKVVLPDPRDLFFKSTIYPSNARRAPPPVDYRPRPFQSLEGIPVSKAPPSPEPENPPRPNRIESYAQLSSLPEFKAFRMDQDNGDGKNSRHSTRQRPTNATEGSGSASQSGSSSPRATTSANVDLEWQQWKMREIRVVKRRRKQEYIRSGTHDFSIRLWSNYEA